MDSKRPYKDKFQPDYIHISEMSEKLISEGNISSRGKTIEDMDEQYESIKIDIAESQLDFLPEKLYTQFISSKQSQLKMKTRTDMCPGCGKQLKKFVQCELCGQVYCRECCFRKRGYPVRVQQDIRSCCETCHRKFVKLMNNQDFYQQMQTLLKVYQANKNKAQKAIKKTEEKQEILKQLKDKKLGEKIKQKNLENQIAAEEKKIKKLDEECRKIVMEKAQRIKRQEQRIKQEQRIREEKQKQALRKKELERQQLRKMEEEIQRERANIQKAKLQRRESLKQESPQPPPFSPLKQKRLSVQQTVSIQPIKAETKLADHLMAEMKSKNSNQSNEENLKFQQQTNRKSQKYLETPQVKIEKQKQVNSAQNAKILSSQFSSQTKDLDYVQSTDKGTKSDIEIKGSLAQQPEEQQQQINLSQMDLSRMSENQMLSALNRRNSRRNTLKKQSLVTSQQGSDYKKSQISNLDSPQKKQISNNQKQNILRNLKNENKEQQQEQQQETYTDQKGKCQCTLI